MTRNLRVVSDEKYVNSVYSEKSKEVLSKLFVNLEVFIRTELCVNYSQKYHRIT